MKNVIVFVFVFLSLLCMYFYVHIYTAKFVSRISIIKNKNLTKVIFLFLFIFSLLCLIFRATRINNIVLEKFYIVGLLWMGTVVILTNFCLLGDVVTMFIKGLNKNIVVYLVLVMSLVSVLYSVHKATIVPRVKQIKINFNKKIPVNINEINIVFIADTHIDFRYKNKIIFEIFKKISQSNPDFVVVGGDFLDPGIVVDDYILKIKEFELNKIAVFGNHEYYFGLDKAKKIFEDLGFTVLKNNSLVVDKINFIGLADIRTENLSKKDVLEIIAKNYKNGLLNIIISHQPLYFKEISENFDVIMLSAHTHKGQIFPFHIFTKFAYRYFYGLYKNKNSYLYVTSGAGVWGPPIRFFAEPEIIQIFLM